MDIDEAMKERYPSIDGFIKSLRSLQGGYKLTIARAPVLGDNVNVVVNAVTIEAGNDVVRIMAPGNEVDALATAVEKILGSATKIEVTTTRRRSECCERARRTNSNYTYCPVCGQTLG
jgi:hypothetical protein